MLHGPGWRPWRWLSHVLPQDENRRGALQASGGPLAPGMRETVEAPRLELYERKR